jgi:hypothetical protein
MKLSMLKLLAIFLVAGISAQAQPPPPPPPCQDGGSPPCNEEVGGDDTDDLARLLRELDCSPSQMGYLCAGSTLKDFEEYKWSHPDLMNFARKFRNIYDRLAQESSHSRGSIRIALQGEADSQEIHKFKLWGDVEPELGRREGRAPSDQVTNTDLAWLRSRALYRVLRKLLPSIEIQELEPVAHKSPNQNTGRFRAAKIYISIEAPI